MVLPHHHNRPDAGGSSSDARDSLRKKSALALRQGQLFVKIVPLGRQVASVLIGPSQKSNRCSSAKHTLMRFSARKVRFRRPVNVCQLVELRA